MRRARQDQPSAGAQQAFRGHRRTDGPLSQRRGPLCLISPLCIPSQHVRPAWMKPFNEVSDISIVKVQVESEKQAEVGDPKLLLGFPEAVLERVTSD